MAQASKVYSCLNDACKWFQYKSSVLYSVTIDGKLYQLNPEQELFQYVDETGNALSEPAPDVAICPHCGNPPILIEHSVDPAKEKLDILNQLDSLDSKINELFELFKKGPPKNESV